MIAAAIRRHAGCPAERESLELADRVRAEAGAIPVGLLPPGLPEDDERIASMHRESRYVEGPELDDHHGVQLWPVRLLAPAPAGKMFARNTGPGQPLQMAFGDVGHVARDENLDWPQWYRLGVWHAGLTRRWAGQVRAAETPQLQAAFADLPPDHLRKVGVHEAVVHGFTTWPTYFLDLLVAAGKVVLEERLAGEHSGAEQLHWLRATGRVHLEWFVDQLRARGVTEAST